MVVRSHHRGHKMWFDDSIKEWRYHDDGTLVKDHHQTRPCGDCGGSVTSKGHDPCIANLPGVRNACCGHGEPSEAYLQFEDGTHFKGIDAFEMQKNLIGESSLS